MFMACAVGLFVPAGVAMILKSLARSVFCQDSHLLIIPSMGAQRCICVRIGTPHNNGWLNLNTVADFLMLLSLSRRSVGFHFRLLHNLVGVLLDTGHLMNRQLENIMNRTKYESDFCSLGWYNNLFLLT